MEEADIDQHGQTTNKAAEPDADLEKQQARERQWTLENRGALADANTFLERYGLWSDAKRLF